MPKLSYTAETMPSSEEFQRQLAQAFAEANPVDDLLMLAEELHQYENRYGMTSAEFFRQFQAGALDDELQHCIEWAADYTSFVELKQSHKHTPEGVFATEPPDLADVLREIDGILYGDSQWR